MDQADQAEEQLTRIRTRLLDLDQKIARENLIRPAYVNYAYVILALTDALDFVKSVVSE